MRLSLQVYTQSKIYKVLAFIFGVLLQYTD
jgi:hypothetical protein